MIPTHYPEFFEAVSLGGIVVWLFFLYLRRRVTALAFTAAYLSVPGVMLFLQSYQSYGTAPVEGGKIVVVVCHALLTSLLVWATWDEMWAPKLERVPVCNPETWPRVQEILDQLREETVSREVRFRHVSTSHTEEVRKLLSEVSRGH